MTELKPCPWPKCLRCHAPKMSESYAGGLHYVECPTCNTQGPLMFTEHEAADAWNELPREQEKPE